ncbi:MAG TPA: sigma 54-interacting transcriptional regulator [Terriglobales bacterium]|jgi:two-component system, NtrC family, response regulator AtoC|nr:MAG: sigma-54-dependent Fis family transcriptional regulator [Acidobacteriota bacterium]HEV2732772.1 sigma 54-interacting transcriptional regulator [Terriglobales bacterium]
MTTISSVSSLISSLGEIPPETVVFGHSETMQSLRERMDKVASANVPVLIQGESGTGKDIIARMIHARSPWRTGPYVKVNCPAIPGTLLESELFGYEKGAFTGAYGTKPGRVEMAHRGTLFLDEISELDLSLQSKLLQLLQDGQFCRIGAQEDKKVEVRVVCATNRRLEEEIETGTFRQDLFYRINVVNLHMPPLRERRGDIEELAAYFLEYYNRKYNCRARALSADLMSALQKYHWPGNIRELENLIKRYVILGNEEVISSDLVGREQEYFNPDINLDGPISLKKLTRQATRELERKVILRVLQAHHWNRKQAARALSISYRALLYKIRDAGLPPNRSKRRTEAVAGQSAAAD